MSGKIYGIVHAVTQNSGHIPMFWNFIPEKLQNLENLVKYLRKSDAVLLTVAERGFTATCWALAHACCVFFNTCQCPQGADRLSGSDDKTETAEIPTLAL